MLVRCSAIGSLMTNPRSKSEVLSETCKSMVKDIFLEKEYGYKKEFWSRYTDKGNEMEDEAIQFAGEVLGWDFVVKNEGCFTNDFISGTPDINTDNLLADIKCSWDIHTFPMFESEVPNKGYYWQLQGYMWLCGKEESELVYCLMDTPLLILEDEVRRAHWKANLLDESLELREAIQSQHEFSRIEKKNRVKRFIIKRDNEAIEQIKERVILAREYYEQLKSEL